MKKRPTNQKEKAEKIEIEITEKLKEIGEAIHVNSEYDILLDMKIPIEVKSSELCILAGKKPEEKYKTYRRPYFKIKRENHQKLIDQEGYYCLVITFKKERILTLFARAKELKVKDNRSIEFIFANSEVLYDNYMMDFDQFKEVIENARRN